jgi:tyrosine-protein phosphatase YwqE
MFSFFSNKSSKHLDAFGFIGTDMHNHILPGIDDGSADIETSMLLLEGIYELGFKNLICTPHILSDVHPNTPTTIEASYNELLPEYSKKYNPDYLSYAAEYMIDYDFEELLKAGNLLSFGGTQKYILIEMSYLVESPNLKHIIFGLLTSGYQPILAHPERYSFYHHKLSYYEDLHNAGCQLQLNLLSLSGHYGGRVKTIGEKLIDKGLINWLGTDLHHFNHLETLKKIARDKKVLKKIGKIKDLKNCELLTH